MPPSCFSEHTAPLSSRGHHHALLMATSLLEVFPLQTVCIRQWVYSNNQKGSAGTPHSPDESSYCPLATPGSPPPGAIAGSCWACRVIPTGKIGLPIPSNISALPVYHAAIAEMMNP